MSTQTKVRKVPSLFWLMVTQRLQRSWAFWRLRSLAKRRPREERRLQLMQVQLDNQLLLLSQLEQMEQLVLFQVQEQQEIRSYRLEGQLQLPPPEPKSELDRLLGL